LIKAEDPNAKPAAPATHVEYVVRCGSMRSLGVMSAAAAYQYGDQVVVRSERGTELGTVLCEATAAATSYMQEATTGRILRPVTDEDRQHSQRLHHQTAADIEICRRCIAAHGLSMQLVDFERILGGELVVVYYLADARVDFRQLVRDLAKEFQTRVEMRHIGVRDEAKLLADYGDCGQPICCATFLSKMPPVSMKMAKLQKATLDPAKISGRCGRLKCCLRYEFDTYQALSQELPPVGSLLLTRDGNVTVLAQDILSKQLVVKTEDDRRIMLDSDQVVSVVRQGYDNAQSGRRTTRRKGN
jgi:cell fate regulator YaaT (PSP1 superfamily)